MILERLYVGSDPIPAEDYYDTEAEGALKKQKKKLLDLYYDCAGIVDGYSNVDGGQWKLVDRLNKFFQDNLNKSL